MKYIITLLALVLLPLNGQAQNDINYPMDDLTNNERYKICTLIGTGGRAKDIAARIKVQAEVRGVDSKYMINEIYAKTHCTNAKDEYNVVTFAMDTNLTNFKAFVNEGLDLEQPLSWLDEVERKPLDLAKHVYTISTDKEDKAKWLQVARAIINGPK